jgi:tRNA-specific 2-thiouridylase
MLATLDPGVLERVRFPLGEQSKDDTRAEAAAAGLAAATRAESQEACFLAGDDYRRFLERQGVPRAEGDVVDERGAVVGRHGGYWKFTPGQRRGLGVAAGRPLYVIRTDRTANSVVVGDREALAAKNIAAEGRLYVSVDRAQAKLRYRSAPVPSRVAVANGGFSLELEEPVHAVATGQIAALYDRDAVVGAGVITSVE